MTELFDILQILAWAVTYILIIVCSFRNRGLRMPLLAGVLNLVWETTALIQSPHWGHVVWIVLDIVIFIFNINNISRKRYKAAYVLFVAVAIVLANSVAVHITAFENWMLVSVFIVDLIMAIDYLLGVRKIAIPGKIAIAITKLLGDFFAWMSYLSIAWYIALIGLVVFLLNITYLCYCLEESQIHKRKRR